MKLFDTTAAAKKLGISGSRLRQLRIDGRIKGIKFGNSWAFTEAEIHSYVPRPSGRPKIAGFYEKPQQWEVPTTSVEQDAQHSLEGVYGVQTIQEEIHHDQSAGQRH